MNISTDEVEKTSEINKPNDQAEQTDKSTTNGKTPDLLCEIGQDEKCLTCSNEKGKCETCNPFYKLINGKCYPDYTIKATYKSDSVVEHIKIYENKNINLKAKMYVDGEIIELNFNNNYYNFNNIGENTIYFYFDTKCTNNCIISSLFKECDKLISIYIPQKAFDTIKFDSLSYFFQKCTKLENVIISGINTDNLQYIYYMFSGCTSLKSVNISNVDFKNVISAHYMFENCISLTSIQIANFKKLQKAHYMFYNCTSLKNIEFINFITDNLKEMHFMFCGCSSLQSLDLSKFNLSQVEKMEYAFKNCSSLITLDFSKSNVCRVKTMEGLFSGCHSLHTINLTYFYIENVGSSLQNIFYDCNSVISIDLTSFNTKKIIYMNSMFYNCYSLTSINIASFDTSQLSEMNYMFYNCSSLLNIDLSHFKTDNLNFMKYTFTGCSSLKSIDISNFYVKNIETNHRVDYLFANCTNLQYIDISTIKSLKYCTNIFQNVPDYGSIRFCKKIESDIKKILPYWNYIPVE